MLTDRSPRDARHVLWWRHTEYGRIIKPHRFADLFDTRTINIEFEAVQKNTFK